MSVGTAYQSVPDYAASMPKLSIKAIESIMHTEFGGVINGIVNFVSERSLAGTY